MVKCDGACNLNNVNEPITELIFKWLKRAFKAMPVQMIVVVTLKGDSYFLIDWVQL
jgi:hypothetical protein